VLPISIHSTIQEKPIRKAFISDMTNMEATFSLIFKEEQMTRQMPTY